ncbi:MAG: N-6 DNA methylase [Pseudomonadota bacterium]|nr:N-6 DNA methylase [Pseudomonadota bacterium]
MLSLGDSLSRITSEETPPDVRLVAMREFAAALSWTPNYELHAPVERASVYDHLVVHHGLANSAVISFVRGHARASDLSASNLRNLLQISYNNMIDWHFFVSQSDAVVLNNLEFEGRQRSFDEVIFTGAPDYLDFLSSEGFVRKAAERRRRYRTEACDDALLSIVDKWKRLIRDDFPEITNRSISTLFNALFLLRGCEDRHLSLGLNANRRILTEVLEGCDQEVNFSDFVSTAFQQTEVAGDLSRYLNFNDLQVFSTLDRATLSRLIRDLYEPREAPFSLNFALMSKHALSRIYEKFVAIFVESEGTGDQLSFLKRPLIEKSQKHFGAVYTPQFIASFFARYLRDNTTPKRFREMSVLDPACGSGIFLRSVVEEQCNVSDRAITKDSISDIFSNVCGVDQDGNALEATRLSLALLHLVTTDTLPSSLNLVEADAFALESSGGLPDGFDAILTNPPYIKLDNLSAAQRESVGAYLGDHFSGRADAYLAFMSLCLKKCKPGAFAFFVIPQTFLRARNAAFIRAHIGQAFDVRCLVDLSAVRVFEGVGAYSILLIVQRRHSDATEGVDAIVAQVTDSVGAALQAVLDEAEVRHPYYKVFSVGQIDFQKREWIIRPPEVDRLSRQLGRSAKLSDYLDCYQGFVTGADEVFIRDESAVPETERDLYAPYLPDREMTQYEVPKRTHKLVLYPYDDGELITEEDLKERFPDTWTYLSKNKDKLTRRKRSDGTPWWRPYRPRAPERILRPKIVAPHLMLTPRFAVDHTGCYVTKHGPFMITKVRGPDELLLLDFFCAVLNSSITGWYIRTHMPTFSRGYSRLEVATLKEVPVPKLEGLQTFEIERLAKLNRDASKDRAAAFEIDRLVASMFDLEDDELNLLGIEST